MSEQVGLNIAELAQRQEVYVLVCDTDVCGSVRDVHSDSLEKIVEKRWSERKQLCVGVDVYRDGDLLSSGRSADIGLGGIFLGMDSLAGLQKDSNVDLVFCLQSGENEEDIIRHRMCARVARVADRGVGLKFCDFDTSVFRSLQEIMAYQTQQGSATCSVVR